MSGLKIQKDKIKLDKITHSVRASQAILQYGTGAMVDFPDQTLMTAAPEYWAENITKIHDERLEKLLNVDYFGMPGNEGNFRISYVRFPQWYFCPKCRRFQPISKWYKEYLNRASHKKIENDKYMSEPKCMECKQNLVATRIVVACEHGHIDDFPWIKWVHSRNLGGTVPICSNPELEFITGTTAAAGLEGLTIKCKCGAKANLRDAFDPDIFKKLDGKLANDDFICTGNQPWKHSHEKCTEYPRTMQRGASSIYFPHTVSSLVIPPYSEKTNSLIEESEQYREVLTMLKEFDDERAMFVSKRLDKWVQNIAMQTSLDLNVVRSILTRKLLDVDKQEVNGFNNNLKYRAEEYKALTGDIPKKDMSSGDFLCEEKISTEYDIYGIKKVCLVKKVREVQALTGFSRIKYNGSFELNASNSGFVSVKEPETRWYPAYQVKGEGIFLEFQSELINKWSLAIPDVNKRAEEINTSYRQTLYSQAAPKNITSKFLLLHTLSHLLIRQLSFECGYSIASLRERIYCGDIDDGYDMSGILIYTASGDSEGTLGGLARQGYPDVLSLVFKKALRNAIICSNDPVCISSSGQGRDMLNLAACHACTLLPETSCEEFNAFLDRGVVVGTFDNPSIGFFRDWIDKMHGI